MTAVRDSPTGPLTSTASTAEVCVTAVVDTFADGGEIIASAFGIIPAIGVQVARATVAPDLLISDGEATMLAGTWPVGAPPAGTPESWTPFRTIFDLVWHGARHVMMIPGQVDRFGNANISAIGDHRRPTAQLIGVRGAPGNSVNHPTSYWVPRHSRRVFVPAVDMVSGVGTDRASAAGPAASRFHDLRRIITNLAVLDLDPDSGALRLVSVHPGVTVERVQQATGFPLVHGDSVAISRLPSPEELRLIRDVVDPGGLRDREVPA